PFLRNPVIAARVVCGNHPVAATSSSSVAPSGRWSNARTRAVLLTFRTRAAGACGSIGAPSGFASAALGAAVIGSRAKRRARLDFGVVVIGGLRFRKAAPCRFHHLQPRL